MKIVLEQSQVPHENEDYNNGLQFLSLGYDDDVFVQIGNLSIRVNKEQLKKALSVFQ
jgi:hypothetical protein